MAKHVITRRTGIKNLKLKMNSREKIRAKSQVLLSPALTVYHTFFHQAFALYMLHFYQNKTESTLLPLTETL